MRKMKLDNKVRYVLQFDMIVYFVSRLSITSDMYICACEFASFTLHFVHSTIYRICKFLTNTT